MTFQCADFRLIRRRGAVWDDIVMTFLFRKELLYNSIIIAVGANLPARGGASPLEICARAARAVASIRGIEGAIQSRWFSSAPIPSSEQPRFINGVVRVHGKVSPVALLETLHAIEASEGRVRLAPNAARTLDLDLIDMDGVVSGAASPILPHPRAHLRAFVLLPLRDVAPDWCHPTLRIGIDALIAGLPAQDIRPVSVADRLAQPGASA